MSLKSLIQNHAVISCEKTASIEEIAGLMEENDVGAIVVEENDKPIGIITDRDLVLRCLTKGRDSFEASADEVMTSPIETVPADAGIYEVIDQMSERRVRRICVVDQQGKCQGVVSLGDIMELLARELGKVVQAAASQDEKLVKESKSA